MMTSSHQSHTTSFKPRRVKKPPHQISHMRPSPVAQPVLKCPRCDSVNTKFCYYNNYSLSQPRHYCKNCHRYWTRGGALRNVPIGGSTRNKNKPSSLQVISSPPPPIVAPLSSHELYTDGFRMNRAMIDPPLTAFSGGFSGYMFPLDPSYNLASSSIESLSSLNQDMHLKLQQQRLITSMFQQDSPPVMFHNVELLPPSMATMEWALDGFAMGGAACGSNENNGDREGNLGSWYHNPNNSMP